MASVLLEGVSKVYPYGTRAVVDLSLEVGDGELLVLIGPSGSGKSTTLRTIAGLEEVSSGEVRFGGEVVNRLPPHCRNVAMVFQEDALQPHWTIRGNLAFGLKMRRGNVAKDLFIKGKPQNMESGDESPHAKPKGEIDQRISKAAHLLGIEHLLDRRPWQLSGGERQRVALGRALIRSPSVLLLDEPLAHLDAALRDQLRCELRRLNQAMAITMIYVTHDWQEAMTLGDRIAVLDAGRLQQVGPPLQVYDRPQTLAVAGMLGSPPMNFIAGRLVADSWGRHSCLPGRLESPPHDGVRFVGGGWETALAESQSARLAGQSGREVVWGVRPEHVRATVAGDSPAAAINLAKISVVETLGDSTILRLRPGKTAGGIAGVDLTVRIPGRCQWRAEDEVIVSMEAENCHVFDSDSKQNLLL